jgi:P-type Ca2+ transporter type 2C
VTTSATTAGGAAEPHRHSVEHVLAELDVDPARGLPGEQVVTRRVRVGPNQLPEAERVPAWRRLLAQLRDVLIVILLVAAAVSFVVTEELKTPIVVLVVVVFNAVLGFVQENRAEASLDALRAMLESQARVRRDGAVAVVPTADLVPGDVVLVEAGDRVPADGRLLHIVRLEVDEAALTGESSPVEKSIEVVDRPSVPLADRSNVLHMNTTVTRGRGEVVVTATGAETEIGRVAGLLRSATPERSPLQHQLDDLARSLALLAGVVVAVVVGLGLARGEDLSGLVLTAVALAVASIPEGLPAVTAVTLALGVSRMARSHAIVKRLASVETLGCTSVICTDKTGTLTLNQMTVREVVVGGRTITVSGEGYGPEGRIGDGGELPAALTEALAAMVLANDAAIRPAEGGGWGVVGDPTEGALVVLAAKGGVDADVLRDAHPRVAEVPFDSVNRFMATVHDLPRSDGSPRRLVCAKGATDALLPRSTRAVGGHGDLVPIEGVRDRLTAEAARMAAAGLRVLAVAVRDLDPSQPVVLPDGDPLGLVQDLALLALVGIQDPPRPEARAAIVEARSAGIDVKVITGDHATTATAIARELGLAGPDGAVVAVTGADLDALDDRQLAEALPGISLFARVDPQHKLRLVDALQAEGHVVAMTGDGVNDAPALKQADIGVAMGITGTEVTKEAATMVLADDDFATIVGAVHQGRTIYDNIVKFVRFQLSTTLGFAALFVGAGLVGLAGGKPFTAIAILWVNVIMDGPPAMALALDPGDTDLMQRRPRPRSERLLTRRRWAAIAFAAVVMAAGTLLVLAAAPGPVPRAGTASVAGTMAFNTFVLFQFFNILNVRSDHRTVLRRQTLTNPVLWAALGTVLALQLAVTHVGLLQRLFDTTSLTLAQWAACAAVASSVLWAEELRKAVLHRGPSAGPR